MSLLLAVTSGGAVNYTLTCDAGSYSYSGQSATLQVRHSLVCDAGSYVYTGQAATLQVVHSLTCNVGAYVYSGVDATLSYVPGTGAVHYTLTCDSGSYVYSGNDATLSYVEGEAPSSGGWYIPEYPYEYYKRFKKKEIEELLVEEVVVQEEIRSIEREFEEEKSERQITILEQRITGLLEQLYELRALIALLAEQEMKFREEEEMMMLLLLEAA